MIGSRVMTPDQLERLKQHKYSATGKSILDNYMHHFWEWAVVQFPLWFAPNLMTVVGLAANVITSVIVMYLSPDAKSNVPPIWYALCAVGLFVNQTLDACDGKQARRTKTSSPLGELLDHGCDSISALFVQIAFLISMQMGEYPEIFLAQVCLGMFLFYCAHWQTYVTGTLRFGKIDVTETQFSAMGAFLAAAYFDPQVFSMKIFGIPIKAFPTMVAYSCAFYTICGYISTARSSAHKNVCEGSSYAPLFPAMMTFIPSVILHIVNPAIFLTHPVLFVTLFGLLSVKLTFVIIVSHMTRTPLDVLDETYATPLIVSINSLLGSPIPDLVMLGISLVAVSLNLLWYAVRVCREICNSLHIEMFRIPVIAEVRKS